MEPQSERCKNDDRRILDFERRVYFLDRRRNLSERQHRLNRWAAFEQKHPDWTFKSCQELFLAGLRVGRSPLYQRTGGEDEL